MSEPNPPSGQPTPPTGETGELNEPIAPSEGAGPTAGEGAAPPPPPGDTTGFGETPPPPPPAKKKSKAPWIIGIAVLLVLVIVGGVVALLLTVGGEAKHAISTPATAGGMKRDTAKEKELQQQLDAAEKQFKTQAKNVSYVKSGVYTQSDKSKGPEGALVFLGAKMKGTDNSPTKFIDSFGKQAGSNGFKIAKVSAGENGGKAVCASMSTGQKIAICAWATKDSMGELIPTVPGWEANKMAAVMRDLRSDVETTE